MPSLAVGSGIPPASWRARGERITPMKQPLSVVGMAVQVRVGDVSAGGHWYERLFRRPPDRTPDPTLWEGALLPMRYFPVMAGEPRPGGVRVRPAGADVADEGDGLAEG